MPEIINIAGRKVGSTHPCFIIAEAGVNHNGNIDIAKQLVRKAAESGADAVKFQTFKAEETIALNAPKAEYQIETTGIDETQFEMVKRLELSYSDFRTLHTYCSQKRILFLSTAFDVKSADFLNTLKVPAYKIPSGEITNLPFLEAIAYKNKPIILSTGMSNLGEVETAVRTIEAVGNSDLILLHCVSNYPADPTDVNLRAMKTMQTAFNMPVGYSDHTLGIEISLAAVAMGACIIEKHFTLDRNLPGPDHQASLEPKELKSMVQGVRKVEAALGHGRKIPATSESNTVTVARRSLVAAQNISSGTKLTEALIAIKRPGTGLTPSMYPYILGRTAKCDIPADTLLKWEMLA